MRRDRRNRAENRRHSNHLAVQRNVAASTQNQALNALLFFYKKVLGREELELKDLNPARLPEQLPTLFDRSEVERLFLHRRQDLAAGLGQCH